LEQCLLATAWLWSRPGACRLGMPFVQVAVLLLSLSSFWPKRVAGGASPD
jgi:hypothetical protein